MDQRKYLESSPAFPLFCSALVATDIACGRGLPAPRICDHRCARSLNSRSHGPSRSTLSYGSFSVLTKIENTYRNTRNLLVRAVPVPFYLLLYELAQNMEDARAEKMKSAMPRPSSSEAGPASCRTTTISRRTRKLPCCWPRFR
jgi:hypothetical protein